MVLQAMARLAGKGSAMQPSRIRIGTLIILAALALGAWSARRVVAQDENRPDQLRRMYDDTKRQLQEAQDRKNQLAAENDKLNARLLDLQKQLDLAHQKLDEANRQLSAQAGDFAERTFLLRSHWIAWQNFVASDSQLQQRWDLFLRDAGGPLPTVGNPAGDGIDTDWPWTVRE